jgi:dipeptidase D
MSDILSLKQSASLTALQELSAHNKEFWHYLLLCLETPRPSDDCEEIRQKLIAVAKKEGLDHQVDKAGNLRIRRKASPGYENSPRIVLQSHLDVVCSKTNDKQHDFHKDPVLAEISKDGQYLFADRTTLGADDGVGIAASLVMLQDKSLQTGQLEALFTAEEETTMGGAENLDQTLLDSQVLLSLDSEEPNSVCVGCAGGFERQFKLPVKRENLTKLQCSSSGFTEFKLFLHGLLGGHTGIDINKPFANALQIIGRLLDYCSETNQFYLAHLNGGNAPNAIPRDCTVQIIVPNEATKQFQADLHKYYEVIRAEFELIEKTRPQEGKEESKKHWQLEISQEAADTSSSAVDASTTRRIIDILLTAPHGPLRFVPGLKDEVDLSVAFSLCSLSADQFIAHIFCRGSSDSGMKAADKKFTAYSRLIGAELTDRFNYFPGWAPNIKSAALAQVIQTHKDLFNVEPRVYSVHAGLEVGLLCGRYPALDCVSIGPLVEGAHSPDERLKISTVKPWLEWLRQSIVNITNNLNK